MIKVLMTGSGGFCGQHLVRYLADQAVDVYTMGVSVAGVSAAIVRHFTIANITAASDIATVLETVRPDYIFHLAGVASVADAAMFYQVNASYAAALLQALEITGMAPHCPTLLVGTSAEYGLIQPDQVPIHEATVISPYHHYGISKLAQTHMGMASARTGRPVIMVRPFNLVGPGMPPHLAVQSFARQVVDILQERQPPTIEVGNLGSSRDFIDVCDAIPIYWQLIQNPQAYGQVVNVCSGQGIVISEILHKLIELAGIIVEVKVDPQRFKALDIPVHYGCTKKLKHLIGATPQFDLQLTLQKILHGLIANA